MMPEQAAGPTDLLEKEGADRGCASVYFLPRPRLGHVPAFGRALLFLALALSFLGSPRKTCGQEVVVFTDFRSLVVSSHREAGPWVYFRVGTGELAVQKSQIVEIRNEGPQAEVAAKAIPPPVPVAIDDESKPVPTVEESVVEMEPPTEKPPPQTPRRGPMDGVVRPMGMQNRQPLQMGTIGGAGPNSLKK